MDLTVLKNPVVLAFLAGSIIVTNIVTYNITAPAADYCGPAVEQALLENKAALDELRQRAATDDADLERALRPREGLNEKRGGGLNWNDSIR